MVPRFGHLLSDDWLGWSQASIVEARDQGGGLHRRTDRSAKRPGDAAAHIVPNAEPAKALGHGSQGGDQIIAVAHAIAAS